jgi:hypothetical protein
MSYPLPPHNYKIIQLDDARFEPKSNASTYRLIAPMLYFINGKQQLRCYVSGYGNLTVFQMPTVDIDYLNSLTYQLVRLANVRHGNIDYLSHDGINFFPYDRDTRLFNKYGEPIMKTEFINTFSGRVALRILGLEYDDKFSRYYLKTSVCQVKIELEDDVLETPSPECLFDTISYSTM